MRLRLSIGLRSSPLRLGLERRNTNPMRNLMSNRRTAGILACSFVIMATIAPPLHGQSPLARKPGRSVVRAEHGMVSSSQPLASQVGLEVLKRGGNAVDAAIAMAAVLNVTEPMMTGVGGDMFALVYWSKTGELKGLNASGRPPPALNLDYFIK